MTSNLDNPFAVLEVTAQASKSEIISAVGRAMRERRLPLQQIAWAQKALLDPVSCAAHSFVHALGISPDSHGSVAARDLQGAGGIKNPRKDEEPLVHLTVFEPPP